MKTFSNSKDSEKYTSDMDIDVALMLFQSSQQAKAMIDIEMNIVRANQSFCREMDYSFDSKKIPNIYDFSFSHFPNFKEYIASLQAGTLRTFEFEKSYSTTEGHVKTLSFRLEGSYNQGTFIGALLTLSDVTRKKQQLIALQSKIDSLTATNNELENRLNEDQQHDNFAHIASHDMKEPLRMIGNFSQLIARKYSHLLDESGQEYLGYVLGGVKNMNDMINDLVEYANLDKVLHNTQSIDLDMLIELAALQNGLNVDEISLNALPKTINGDRNKLKQLFHCLLDNAIKYKHPKRPVAIAINCKEHENQWQFSISDNGLGINEAYFEKIFTMFKKLHAKSDYQGSGIGLAICKKIVKHHKGEIWLESTEGKGTTFYFTLAK